MIKKIISCSIVMTMLALPIQVRAQELQGTVTSLVYEERAPYAGILLDPIAASKMLVDKKYLRIELELQLRKEFQKELAEKTVAYNLLKVDHDSLRKIYEQTLLLKNNQINDLNLLLKEEMNKEDYSEWWVVSGVALGIVLSLGVFYASVEIAK